MSERNDRTRLVVVAAVAVVALALLGTAVVGVLARPQPSRGFASYGPLGSIGGPDCPAPTGPGTVVTFVATDMGAGTGMMSPGTAPGGGMMSGQMAFMPRVATAPAGTVTVAMVNLGVRVHELLVLPLPAGTVAGQRRILADDRVSEQGKLGEAHVVCPQGSSADGVPRGGTGTVTLNLAAGRYQVVCNKPGHYRRGMYATLVIT